MVGAQYWRKRFAAWSRRLPQRDGYTLLVPVPGDLPVFLDLSLAVCRLQDPTSRVATYVVPDVMTPMVQAAVDRARPSWHGDLQLLELPLAERLVLPRLNDPGRNHGAQIITGVSAARSSHVVLHDADLFLLQADAHEAQYQRACEGGLAVLGVSPSWDPWYAAHGLTLAATWEMTARTDWLRSFPPHRLIGHDADLFGERHTFDTTFWGQCHTPQQQIGVHDLGDDLIHFNYVISTYRRFQKRPAGAFHDAQFRLLLIRVLIDLFDQGQDDSYALPSLTEMAAGLGNPHAGITYSEADAATFSGFRTKLQGILDGPWTTDHRRAQATTALKAFDRFYDGAVTVNPPR
ncbi:MAG TPA: hypothetical protein VF635_04645 [Propionibacteriaceae bacterium]|jgi:hypothetical protein